MNIRFLLDENIPYALIEFLEEKGYHAEHLKRMGKGGIKNGEVYRIAEEGRMWIVTRDADFQSYYRFTTHNIGGVIVIRQTNARTEHLLRTMENFLERHKDKLNRKHLIIIEDDRIRIY